MVNIQAMQVTAEETELTPVYTVHSVSMDIILEKNGDAIVTEEWKLNFEGVDEENPLEFGFQRNLANVTDEEDFTHIKGVEVLGYGYNKEAIEGDNDVATEDICTEIEWFKGNILIEIQCAEETLTKSEQTFYIKYKLKGALKQDEQERGAFKRELIGKVDLQHIIGESIEYVMVDIHLDKQDDSSYVKCNDDLLFLEEMKAEQTVTKKNSNYGYMEKQDGTSLFSSNHQGVEKPITYSFSVPKTAYKDLQVIDKWMPRGLSKKDKQNVVLVICVGGGSLLCLVHTAWNKRR